MASRKLTNYLRTARRRAGFSQDEIAFLLGVHDGTKLCRYEQFRRVPLLKTALALEIVFASPARELFAGTYEQLERDIRKRARRLIRKLERAPRTRSTDAKLELLRAITCKSNP